MLDPFRGFGDMRGEVERMFDEALGSMARRPGSTRTRAEWAPAGDVLSREGDLIVRVELPGVRPEDVNATLQGGVLTVAGEHEAEEEEERGGYYVRERRLGSFRRSMTLPEGTDESKVRARFEHGVVEVAVEGAAAVRGSEEPRRIEIEGFGD